MERRTNFANVPQGAQQMSRISEDLDLHHTQQNSHVESTRMNRVLRPLGLTPKFAIIGAGIAGLRCAEVLIENGTSVTIFEARDRVGGRVHQLRSGGHLMDLGPNWIHGTERNPIAELAKRTKTITHDWEEEQCIYDSDSTKLDDATALQLTQLVWNTISKAFQYSNDHAAEIASSESLLDYFKKVHAKENPTRLSYILKVAHMWGAFVGDPISTQSLKNFWLEECIEGETSFVAGTYQAILQEIASVALRKANVRFNEEVVHFETKPSSPGGPPQITITTANGHAHTFNEVILTTPLGWLKRNKATAFTPPLPRRLSRAIDNINYGRLEKVYITFPSAWWHPSSQPHSGFSHFLSPDYVVHPPHQPWNQEFVNLAALPAPTAHPTLLFYLYGPCSTHLVSILEPHAPSSAAHTKLLTDFFAPYYSLLPHYSPSDPACTPAAFLATMWQADKFAGNGSYTNYQVGLEDGGADIEAMREARGEEAGLWLAGEHTAPFVALGTTTGAYWAGERVAGRILRLYGVGVGKEGVSANGVDVEAKDKDPLDGEPRGFNLNGMAL